MNKTLKKLLLCATLSMPFYVYASSGSTIVSCDKTSLNPGDKTTCSILATSTDKLFGITGSISLDGNIALDGNLSYYNTFTEPTGNTTDLNFSLVSMDGINASKSKIISFIIKNTGSTSGSAKVSVSGVSMTVGDVEVDTISSTGGSTALNLLEKEVTTPVQQNTTPQDAVISNDNKLKSLTIENLPFDFNPNTLEYNLTASEDMTELVIDAKANNKKAKITLPDNLHINEGDNTFVIKVTAEDKTEKEYKLNINLTKEEIPEPGIVSSLLFDLSIEGYPINFDKHTFIYEIKDCRKKKLNIKYTPEDENATVEIIGNSDIEKNDVIVIRITSSNNEITDYILKVNNPSVNSNNLTFIISIILFIISIIGWILILLKRKGGNKIETL